VYCGTLSAELNHLASVHKKDWLRRQLEGHVRDDGGVASTGTFIFISVGQLV
jgi:2-oxoglutarate dehydrogenase complex dehydrogenase (E1) component-like enzyme